MRLDRWLRPIRERLRPAGDHATVFSRIHREQHWGDGEGISGPGSTEARGAQFRDDLIATLRRLEVRVLLDAPCGTCAWTGPVADAVEQYIGVDVVPAIVEANRVRHAGPRRAFLVADITRDPVPAADAILCRDALVHFPIVDVWRALARFRDSGARYLITTTFVERRVNAEIRTGRWRPLNLEAPPFLFPPPESTIDERCDKAGARDKRLAVWRVAALPALRRR